MNQAQVIQTVFGRSVRNDQQAVYRHIQSGSRVCNVWVHTNNQVRIVFDDGLVGIVTFSTITHAIDWLIAHSSWWPGVPISVPKGYDASDLEAAGFTIPRPHRQHRRYHYLN
jgi:hypothetical protein